MDAGPGGTDTGMMLVNTTLYGFALGGAPTIAIGDTTGLWILTVFQWDTLNYRSRVMAVGSASNSGTWSSFYQNAGKSSDDTDHLSIGRSKAYGRYMNGSIDLVGVWSRMLTDDEITELYNLGAGKDYPF